MSSKTKNKEKAKSFFKDFKKFISRGNIIDLAVAVIVGGAFGKIVTSLVNDIITPLIAAAFGGDSFGELRWILKAGTVGADGAVAGEIAIRYGAFIQNILDFLIIAFFIFIVFRIITRASNSIKAAIVKKEGLPPPAPPAPPQPTQEELLTQIRDLLAENVKTDKETPKNAAEAEAVK